MTGDRIKALQRSPDRGRTDQETTAPNSRKTSRPHLDFPNAMGNKAVSRLLQGTLPESQPNEPPYRRRPVHEQSVQFKRGTNCKRQDCYQKRRAERDSPKPQHRTASVQAQDERHWNTEVQVAESVLNALGSGESIPIHIAKLFSAPYQSDLGDVRLHRDSSVAADHDAQALAIGRHVAFAPGQYQPGTQKGNKMIGHELAHVVQQSGGTHGVQRAAGRPSGLHESEADAAAAAAMSGRAAPSLSLVLAYAGSVQLEQETTATPTQTEEQSSAEPQGESEPESEPAPQEERTLSPSAVVTRVDRIIGALQGVTWGNDSQTIRNTVTGLTGRSLRAVMVEFRNRGSQHGRSGDGMVEWMLNDLTSDDARAVETHIIRERGLPDTRTWVAARILNCLQGFTSVSTGSDSAEIRRYLEFFTGSDLDGVLVSLETQAGKTQQEMAGWLFGDIGRLDAQRVGEHFGRSGGLRCYDYLAWWRANNIYDLLAGTTSRADSGNILRNFEWTPVDLRRLVMQQLDGMTRNAWGQSAEQALMEDMTQENYESLRALGRRRWGQHPFLRWPPLGDRADNHFGRRGKLPRSVAAGHRQSLGGRASSYRLPPRRVARRTQCPAKRSDSPRVAQRSATQGGGAFAGGDQRVGCAR